MDADIEHLVLSGKLFGKGSHSSSPERSPSPDHGWGDDEKYGKSSEDHDDENGSDDERSKRIDQMLSSGGGANQSNAGVNGNAGRGIGMKPGRTGVKGVLRDRHEADAMAAARKAREMWEVRKAMERANLGGKTWGEEEKERELEKRLREGGGNEEQEKERRGVWEGRRKAKFGHLREVGKRGFVSAVEKEEKGVWVVVHLYDASLERCYALDDTLSRLARFYPQTKFLHARASALGFASSAAAPRHTAHSMPGRYVDDEDDPYADPDDERQDSFNGTYYDEVQEEEQEVDTDMLPTMLVYRDGELVYNWVRVDWEAGKAGVEDLLSRRHVIGDLFGQGNCGLPSDDEDDVVWSDEDVPGS